MTTASLKLRQRLFYYLLIGGLSALTHLFIVYELVQHWGFHPLIANLIAFLIAFNISYKGHRHLTFSRLENQKTLRLPHFFLVAATGGVLNETLYYLLLTYTPLNYMLALFLVLGTISIFSFIISKLWACR